MSSPRTLRFALKAHGDMADIAQYTKLEWGEAQWKEYSRTLTSAFNRVAEFPELGEPRPDLGSGVRMIRIDHHVLYYRATPKTIRILRIRHVRAHRLAAGDL